MALGAEIKKRIDPKQHYAVAIWCIQDVLDRAKELRIKLTKEQATEIIDHLDRKQDASIGISWDTLDNYIEPFQDDYK